jgi:ribosomal silencing factor RsfS
MTKWERMAKRIDYFKGKDITKLSTEEINEFLDLRVECTKIAESLTKIIMQPVAKAINNFINEISKGSK